VNEHAPALEPARFQELFDDFGEEAHEVIEEFVAETQRDVEVLQALLAAPVPAADEVQRAAHKLKSGCLLVGAWRLLEVAAELDLLGREQAAGEHLVAHAPELGAAWAATLSALAPHRP